jgi:tRNA G10  N-methylase Trm11
MQSFVIFGRQPKIGLAEIESLYGADSIKPISNISAVINRDLSAINFSNIGSSVKIGKLLTTVDSSNWQDIENFLIKTASAYVTLLPSGKLKLGISAYNLNTTPKKLLATGLTIKKMLKKQGRSCRLVPNKKLELNSAQVLHNKLTEPLGMEVLLVAHAGKTYVAQTTAVQDIEAYAARDHGRPKRDSQVGMLPPKLAQTILNLAIDHRAQNNSETNLTVLDPFCGTGVMLQEAILMQHNAYGTDLESRMVAYSQANIDWLRQTRHYLKTCDPSQNPEPKLKLETADACEHKWSDFDVIASETYLGRPFSVKPSAENLIKASKDVNTITTKFLKNVAEQTKPGFRMCIAVPAWCIDGNFKHLEVLDSLSQLGYTRAVFKHARPEDLIYHREGQIVARQLVILIRK